MNGQILVENIKEIQKILFGFVKNVTKYLIKTEKD